MSGAQRRPGNRGCLVSVVLGVLALTGLVWVVTTIVGGVDADPGDGPRVAVPAGGSVELDQSGRYRVLYDASAGYEDSGLCERRSRSEPGGGPETSYWSCDPDALAAAGGLTVTAPDGEPVVLQQRTPTRSFPSDLTVWEFTTDQAGTFSVELPTPTFGTDTVIFDFLDDGVDPPLWEPLLFWSVPLLGMAALVIGIVSLVRRSAIPRPGGPGPGAPWPAGPPAAGPAPPRVGLPAGWHPDPAGRAEERWWDGERWTADVRTAGRVAHDPI